MNTDIWLILLGVVRMKQNTGTGIREFNSKCAREHYPKNRDI